MRYSSKTFNYHQDFKKIDFRKRPELYEVGRGEQGVLMVEPYKSEILPHWKFKTVAIAEKSARKIYKLFLEYKKKKDFVGMDMARKFLQMGFTRARRYANHAGGRKYVSNPHKEKTMKVLKRARTKVLPQAKDALVSEKAEAARVFYGYYVRAREDKEYKKMKEEFKRK